MITLKCSCCEHIYAGGAGTVWVEGEVVTTVCPSCGERSSCRTSNLVKPLYLDRKSEIYPSQDGPYKGCGCS